MVSETFDSGEDIESIENIKDAESPKRPLRVLLVCSSGGHLAQLHRLAPWWRRHERRWVTFDSADARSLLAEEEVSWAFHPTTRNVRNLLRNLRLAWSLIPRYRPDLVVSSGAGVAVPFFWVARLRGIRTAYLEVFDRIDSRTVTGRLCKPVTDLFLVQWEDQRELYGDSVVVGKVL
jgi:beta-1,4-N-acetylglucosaminyltransferase